MGFISAHNHDWVQTAGGYQCNNCSATMSMANYNANAVNTNNNKSAHLLHNDVIQQVWKKFSPNSG